MQPKPLSLTASLTLVLALCVNAAQASTSWSQYQGNAGHTGYQGVALNVDPTAAWTQTIAGGFGGFAAADGKVFVSTSGYFQKQYLYTFDAQSGAELWNKDFGSIYSVNPPSVSNGVVYLQTGNHSPGSYFRGYDAATGELKVKTPFAAQWERYQAPAIYDGKAYVNAGYFGGAYSFDLKTGNTRWAVGLPQYDGWTPAINDKHLVALVGGALVELNRDTGATIQSIGASNYQWSGWSSQAAVLVQDSAYAIASNTLDRFDLLSGKVTWSLSGVRGQFAVDGSEIFAFRNGAVTSIDSSNGSVNWMWEDSSAQNQGSFVVATKNLVIVSGGAKTYLLDRHSHQLVQTLASSGQIALGNDQLYIGGGTSLTAYNISLVPEPGTMSLFALGACGLLALRRGRPVRKG